MAPNYTANVSSAALNAEAHLAVFPDGVAVTTPLSVWFLNFSDLVSAELDGRAVTITTSSDRFHFAGLGSLAAPFHAELTEAFNRRVRTALLLRGEPVLSADGEFRYIETGTAARGRARVEVYRDCVAVLPVSDRARRVPFTFMSGLTPGRFELTLSVDGGDWYSLGRLGGTTDLFESKVRAGLEAYRHDAVAAIRSIDARLNQAQLIALATRMPPGVAAPMGELRSIAPSYAAALESRIAAGPAHESYSLFTQMCHPDTISVGIKTHLAADRADDVLWMIAPSAVRPLAAVEFVVGNELPGATFIYKMTGDRVSLARTLNRAMEAAGFRREIMTCPADELGDHPDYAMLIKRTAALRVIRQSFATQIPHSSPDRWTAEVRRYLG